MKTNKPLFTLLLVILSHSGWSQGFVNLNFENSKLTNIVVFGFSTTSAIVPGWSVDTRNYANGDTNSIQYNTVTLDSAGVSLEGTNNPSGPSAIQGKYSIYLQGGTIFSQSGTNGASIWQNGTIPASSLSVYYWGGPLQVSFNGQALSFSAISNAPDYAVWGADISAYAGQTGEFLFNVPWQNSALLDNIQFSTSPIPEPSTFGLFVLSGLFFAWQRARK